MIITKETVWVIMTKDRKYIAKGTPRNRYLISVDDKKDIKRYLTYSSKVRAEAGFKVSGFYGMNVAGIDWRDGADAFEAVEVEMIMQIKE